MTWAPLGHLLPKPQNKTYLPTPADAPQVTVKDHQQHTEWTGYVHEGVVHDASGTICPFDINWRYTIWRDGVDVSDEFALDDPNDD